MARKKAKRPGPMRACESCGALYHPRAKACPKCGAPNPVFQGRQRRKAASGSALEAAVDFVEQAGSIKAARAAMDRIERIRGM